jgi:hypothetical protein
MIAFTKKIISANGSRNSFQMRYFNISAVLGNESNVKKSTHEKATTTKSSNLIFNNENKTNEKAENISRAMTYYLKKRSERGKLIRTMLIESFKLYKLNHFIIQSIDSIMNEKTQEYEIGKRHLARMMGVDIEKFSQTKNDKQLNSVDVKFFIYTFKSYLLCFSIQATYFVSKGSN